MFPISGKYFQGFDTSVSFEKEFVSNLNLVIE